MCEKGKLVKRKVRYDYSGIDLGEYNAEVCDKCGEQYYDEKATELIEKKAKQLGIWGLKERTVVHKTGGSSSLIIKKKLADFIGLEKNKEVIIYPEGKKKLTIEVVG